jgi:hypothetical protein
MREQHKVAGVALDGIRRQAAFDREMRQVRVYRGSSSRRHERVEL